MKNTIKTIFVAAFVLLLFNTASAEEAILSFHSDIELRADASMLVAETIKVLSEGREIKRGVYRDYPITYKDSLGKRHKVKFKVLEVLREGNRIPYKIKRNGNNKRVYMGDFKKQISPGEYTFTLVYETANHIRFNENNEQFYYDVTGNEWSFPINTSSANIKFPNQINETLVKYEGYTGKYGSREKSVNIALGQRGDLNVRTTRRLNRSEGLTVNVLFPKDSFVSGTFAIWKADNGEYDWLGRAIGRYWIFLYCLVIRW